MEYFKTYVSNTCGAGANQLFFSTEGQTVSGRAFYRIAAGGTYHYSLLFQNTIDSTYADGALSHKNLPCQSWQLHSARIGRCRALGEGDAALIAPEVDEESFAPLSFDGAAARTVAPGELFHSDPVRYEFAAEDYLCLEITFSGEMIPYHEESLLPLFTKVGDGWRYDRRLPLPAMIGCDRAVAHRIALAGDSITQGIGVPCNSYDFWGARIARALGERCAVWNLGIGYGRASDAASDGAWLYKVKQNDLTIVCYGVNDLGQGHSEEEIRRDLATIVDRLKEAGCAVILETIPPFDYRAERAAIWQRLNDYIKTELSEKVDLVFDVAPLLGMGPEEPERARYGGHPNAEGSAVWAEALLCAIQGSGLLA